MPRMNAAAWRKESVHRLIDSSSLKAQGNTLYTLGDLAAAEERWTAAVEACSGLWANPITPMASVVLRDADPASCRLRAGVVCIVNEDESCDRGGDGGGCLRLR